MKLKSDGQIDQVRISIMVEVPDERQPEIESWCDEIEVDDLKQIARLGASLSMTVLHSIGEEPRTS